MIIETGFDLNPERTMILIPAFNEEESIGSLLAEIHETLFESDIVVINDGSTDETAKVAALAGARVLNLPCNLGVGGAVQSGFQYAFDNGYHRVIRIDGDGQHPPSEIPKLIAAMDTGTADLIIGSRFIEGRACHSTTWARSLGIRLLSMFLSVICRSRITDPTSGFWLVNRKLLCYFAHEYPTEYPEPEALALLRRHGFSYFEVPVHFRPRIAGKSSIRTWGAIYYMIKVGLALVVDRVKPLNPRFTRDNLKDL